MSEFLNLLLSGIGVAALTGITIFAYKHPNAYGKLLLPLSMILFVITFALVVWNLSNLDAYNTAIHYIPYEKLDEARVAIIDRSPQVTFPYLLLAMIGLVLWLAFLHYVLPHLLSEDNVVKKENDKQ